MNVVQLISSEGFYGAESMLLSLAEEQIRSGLQSAIALFDDPQTRKPGGLADKAAEKGIRVQSIPCAGRFDPKAIGHIRRLLEEQRAGVLHCHGYKADLYGLAATCRRRTALVSTCHNWPDRRASMRAYAVADRFALRWFDEVATPSQQVASTLRRAGVPANKVSVIANGVDLEKFENAPPTLRSELPVDRKFVAGCVGRLIPGKGGAVLLQAAKTVLAACPQAAIVFVGEGECRKQWQALALELDIGQRVFFTGARSDMAGVYASLDVLVLPSFDEAMPMCLLEGLASGCPVISTHVGEIPRLIEAGVSGLLVPPNDAAALAGAILHTIHNPEAAAQRAIEGKFSVQRTYSSAAMSGHYLSLYERALVARSQVLVSSRQSRTDSA